MSAVGPERLSLREAAKRAGVSHAAPYHHFRSKASLLAELADESWALLADVVRAASAAPASRRIEAIVVAYVGFARDQPARMTIMRADASSGAAEARPRTALVLFPVLATAIGDLQAAGLAPAGDPAPLVLTTWATMHGLAGLLIAGPLEQQTAPELIEQLATVVAAELASGWAAKTRS